MPWPRLTEHSFKKESVGHTGRYRLRSFLPARAATNQIVQKASTGPQNSKDHESSSSWARPCPKAGAMSVVATT
jgi:hypothetical protein